MPIRNNKTIKIIPVIVVVAVTAILLFIMGLLKPPIEKNQDLQIIPVVETMQIDAIDFVIPIKTDGTVLPKTQINFAAEIVGKVIFVSEQFSNGGTFKQGDVLVKIDPKDYQLAITRSQANVSARIAALDLEQAKSDLARNDWKKYGKNGKPSALNLNLPQVNSAKAALAGAKADLLLAQRNLEKTKVIAPFDGVIIQKNTDIGQFVNIGMSLASIASTEIAEIRVPLSDAQLQTSGLNDSLDKVVSISSEETSNIQWQGKVIRIEAQRDMRTLLSYVVIEVEKPFVQQSLPLRFNTFVKVELEGQTLSSVFPLERNYMLLNNKIKLLDSDSKLHIQKVSVAYSDDSKFYISEGINNNDHIIKTQLPSVNSGSFLKVINNQ